MQRLLRNRFVEGIGRFQCAALIGSQSPSRCSWSSARTSSNSTLGNVPMRNRLRPSERYGSMSTTPFSRSNAEIAWVSTDSSKSIVATTRERYLGFANEWCRSQYGSSMPTRMYDDDAALRPAIASSPPALASNPAVLR